MRLHGAIQPRFGGAFFAALRCALTRISRSANSRADRAAPHSAASLLPAPITGSGTRAVRGGRDRLRLDVIEWLCGGDPSRARLVRAEPPVAPICDHRLRTPQRVSTRRDRSVCAHGNGSRNPPFGRRFRLDRCTARLSRRHSQFGSTPVSFSWSTGYGMFAARGIRLLWTIRVRSYAERGRSTRLSIVLSQVGNDVSPAHRLLHAFNGWSASTRSSPRGVRW